MKIIKNMKGSWMMITLTGIEATQEVDPTPGLAVAVHTRETLGLIEN